MEVRELGRTGYNTRRCPVCKTEREEVEGAAEQTLFCCEGATEHVRYRLVTELSDGRKVETLVEGDADPITRFVGQSDG